MRSKFFVRIFTVLSTAVLSSFGQHAIASPSDTRVFLLSLTNRWKFNQSGDDPGAGWKEAFYDDSTWPQGNALFLDESTALPTPEGTILAVTNALGEPIITYYFRTHFNFTGNTAGLTLVATNFVDDGAVFYLNGVELTRLRMPSGTVTASTRAFIGPTAQMEVLSMPTSALMQGDNVLAVEVHQDDHTSVTNADVIFGMSLVATLEPPPLPDLIIWGPSVGAHFELRTFASNDCEVLEGCGIPGVRRLFRFATETRNRGTADLVLGAPAGNPLYEFDPCHKHYHFQAYVDFRLLDSNGLAVARGHKIGFSLVDGERWDTTNGPPSDHYDEANQGIQRGWGDLYDYLLPCQYIDITDTPPGRYTLELEVDPDHKLPELNETNNITRVSVEIPAVLNSCDLRPPNDHFADAQVVPFHAATATANSDCATLESGEAPILSDPGGRSVWFRWTAPASGIATFDTEGSDFDTLLAVYLGSNQASLTLVAANDDGGAGRTSRITTNVIANTVYSIAVDGYYFRPAATTYSGHVVLNINPNANDALAAAQPLTGQTGTITGTTLSATREPDEPDHAGNPTTHSIWYSWAPLENGWVTFDTIGSRFNTILAVYIGAIPSLTEVASNDDNQSGASQVNFYAVTGTTYRVAVDGRNGEAGLSTLNWRPSLRLFTPLRTGNDFQFTLLGYAGDRYVVESSSNFLTWSSLLRLTNTTGSLVVTDSPGLELRFYRVRTEGTSR